MERNVYDILILGGGVAGITASVYAKRRNKKVAIIEEMLLGGQLASISEIENFPSYSRVSGFELMENFQKQAKSLNIEVISDTIKKVNFEGEVKSLQGSKAEYFAKSVIIATGLSYKKLGKGEEEFLGRGVSFCAVCDANFYKGKEVCVASKAGSGVHSALILADVAKKVYLLDSEDLTKYASVCPKKNIEIISFADIQKFEGKDVLEKVIYKEVKKKKALEISACFMELGKMPNTKMFEGVLDLDKNGYIKTNEIMETSISEVFACGDIRAGVLKQLVCACSDGAIAGQYA